MVTWQWKLGKLLVKLRKGSGHKVSVPGGRSASRDLTHQRRSLTNDAPKAIRSSPKRWCGRVSLLRTWQAWRLLNTALPASYHPQKSTCSLVVAGGGQIKKFLALQGLTQKHRHHHAHSTYAQVRLSHFDPQRPLF